MTSTLAITPTPAHAHTFAPMTYERMCAVVPKRRAGVWVAQDTADDLYHCLTNNIADTDVAITMQRQQSRFAVCNMKELLTQIKIWKAIGCVSFKFNSKEFEFAGKTYYTFVIQDPAWGEDNAPMCPLLSLTGRMVSGFTYIVARKKVAEFVCSHLKENNDKAIASNPEQWGEEDE
jgi:hypothetical protein